MHESIQVHGIGKAWECLLLKPQVLTPIRNHIFLSGGGRQELTLCDQYRSEEERGLKKEIWLMTKAWAWVLENLGSIPLSVADFMYDLAPHLPVCKTGLISSPLLPPFVSIVYL